MQYSSSFYIYRLKKNTFVQRLKKKDHEDTEKLFLLISM